NAGVPTKVEETGKVFPVRNKASDVLAALLFRLKQSGATLSVGAPIVGLQRAHGSFLVKTPQRFLAAKRVILTSGGRSYPGSGTTGDGYGFAAGLGHTIVAPRPALVPIKVTVPWVAELRGITVPDVRVCILEEGTRIAQGRGSLLFAHFGLSGPVIL